MVCVRKKPGSMRLCIDYRELNKKIMPDGMPIPRIQDVLENFGGHKYFSTLDMSKAYHQGFMHENSQNSRKFSSGSGSRLVCQQHPQLFNDLSTNICQE